MRQFYYGVRDGQGVRQTGVISATSPGEAMALLRERFPLVLRLETVRSPRLFFWQRVREEDLLAFTHQLAAMLDAGLSFGKAMEVLLLDQVHRRPMRLVLVQIAAGVSEGRPFSQMLRHHGQTFPPLYAAMVEAGEASASVPHVLHRLADHLTRTSRVKMEVTSALLYPGLVLVFGLLVSAAILLYGAPILQSMYQGTGLRLPAFTSLFLWVAGALSRLAPVVGVCSLLGLVLLPRLLSTPLLRDRIDYLTMRFSPVRHLLLEAAVARCCRTLATLYGGGVPILQALDMTARTAGNAVLRDTFLQVRDKVAEGSNLSVPLFQAVYFPPMAAGMITAGEAAGSLPDMLERLADYYEVRLDFALKAFSKTAEPILIVAVGLLVGSVVLALGLPLMNLVSVLT